VFGRYLRAIKEGGNRRAELRQKGRQLGAQADRQAEHGVEQARDRGCRRHLEDGLEAREMDRARRAEGAARRSRSGQVAEESEVIHFTRVKYEKSLAHRSNYAHILEHGNATRQGLPEGLPGYARRAAARALPQPVAFPYRGILAESTSEGGDQNGRDERNRSR